MEGCLGRGTEDELAIRRLHGASVIGYLHHRKRNLNGPEKVIVETVLSFVIWNRNYCGNLSSNHGIKGKGQRLGYSEENVVWGIDISDTHFSFLTHHRNVRFFISN